LKRAIDAADGGKRGWLAPRLARASPGSHRADASVEHARSPADDFVLTRMEAS